MKKKSRNFLITLNQVEKWNELYEYLTSLGLLNYIVACKENAPSTGHEHIHCYVQFRNSFRLSVKKLCGAHVDICKGSAKQNVEYVKKQGNIIVENGFARNPGAITVNDVKSMKKKDREDLSFIYYDKIIQLNENEDIKIQKDKYYKEVVVYYIWGDSGVGKTKKAHSLIESDCFHEAKHLNGFWIGVADDEECRTVIYDDFRDSHMKPSEFINFIDYNVHNMNIKGGFIKNRYEKIIITSVQDPESLYEKFTENDKEPKRQWMRRLTHILYLEKNNEDF